jgi:hypothetical protein
MLPLLVVRPFAVDFHPRFPCNPEHLPRNVVTLAWQRAKDGINRLVIAGVLNRG